MIKLETHLHCKGGSGCSDVTYEQILEEYAFKGYKALTLTNHLSEFCFKDYPGENKKEKLSFYFSLVDGFTKKANEIGIKVFWGSEVRAVRLDGLYSEFMVYPKDRKIFYDNELLFYLTQEEMFKFCDKNEIFMYQTHPFREGVAVGNPLYVHGIEGFNGHYHHVNNNDKAMELADKFNLKIMSGSDYHHYNQPILGGIYISENIDTNEDLVNYLFNNQPKLILEG